MAMGIVSDEDFGEELGKCDSVIVEEQNRDVITGEIVEIDKGGRKEGDNNVPESIRKLIGEQAAVEGRESALNLARAFGISDSSVSAYQNGARSTSTYNQPDPALINHINNRKQVYTKRALKKLGMALNRMDQAKLADCTAPQLAHVASVMSNVVKNLEPAIPEDSGEKRSGPTFVFMVPPTNDESKYGTPIRARD